MAVITRDDWNAGPNRAGAITLPVSRLYLHHSVTPQWLGAEAARNLQNIARERGFLDISYNWLVDVAGNQIEGRGWGRAGAHTLNWNSTSHAICLIGNFQNDVPPPAMLAGAAALVRKHAQFGPDRITHGHRDVSSTSCPGQHAYSRIDDINQLAEQAAPPDHEGDDMRIGDEGGHVKMLQHRLSKLLTRDLTVDGVYGPTTAKAVGDAHERLGFRRVEDVACGMFQTKLLLVVDGQWGDWTLAVDRVERQNVRVLALERQHREAGAEGAVEHVPHIHPMEPEPTPAPT